MTGFNPFEISLEALLDICKERHGHLCAGQVLGARLSLLGLKLIDIKDPYGADRKKFLVFVEIDRCATDAIQTVTGCSLGKRTMKFYDYGIMAATFLNLETGKAFRIIVKESAKERAKLYFPKVDNPALRELLAYKVMSEEELFEVEEVLVKLKEEDLPGKPKKKAICSKCQIVVRDGKEVYIENQPLCKICAGFNYFERQK
ncbi:MAG: formylmethanofuran dehydrogenase subunit E family protein [Caldimicrobium sp.]|nr:formylmethanofuran dehydrogenase subunit E family protein [Caldimicrobium sp.]MCX7873451.1 formylmethanofuran dehydrogenase subunit E family protein [Caldimicrobium sp.]MDW8095038.1 formylmethanofuran dehydrogenase subunit E family protein [Caldimicrobium sp.]